MPSLLLSAASGSPFPIYSGGLPFSGQSYRFPYSYVNLKYADNASGNAYIGYTSGGPFTVNSGGAFPNGSGLYDLMMLAPGERYQIPKLEFISGCLNIFATCDAAASGQGRLYFDVF